MPITPEAPITPIRARHALVLSDLHLSPRGPALEFQGQMALEMVFRDFAETRSKGEGVLVLNGDVLDYLHLRDYDEGDLRLAPRRTEELLDALPFLVDGLREVLNAGHKVLVVPGNHDPELALFEVHQLLREQLNATTGNLLFHLDTEPWNLEIGSRRVRGEHGQAYDGFNDIHPVQLLRHQAAGDRTFDLPPGSRLVCQVFNSYRWAMDREGQRRFAFLDLLKPEVAVFLLLLYLDPVLFGRRLTQALGPFTQGLLGKIRLQLFDPPRTLSGEDLARGGTLAGDRLPSSGHDQPRDGGGRGPGFGRGEIGPFGPGPGTAEGSQADTDAILDDLAALLVAGMDGESRRSPSLAIDEMAGYLLSGASDRDATRGGAPQSRGVLGISSSPRDLFLRGLAMALRSGSEAFDLEAHDSLFEESKTLTPAPAGSIYCTGHTHKARRIRLEGPEKDRLYLNTGTWQSLLRPPVDGDLRKLRQWVDTLRSGDFEREDRYTAARIDENEADLVVWDKDTEAFESAR